MKFSYAMLPDHPLDEALTTIELADDLGFYACYATDETWHKDLWVLFAAAASRTNSIRFGPSVSPVLLREPSHLAQALATLDELSGGRAEAALSCGNAGLLEQYRIPLKGQKPLSRTKEALHVVRTLLDEGTITFDGEFFSYDGLFTFARPVQERLPLKLGAMRGPLSFEAAGEFSDGCHHALSYTREAYEYMVRHLTIGAERAGKDVSSLDIGAWVVFATSMDGDAAREAARSMVGIYASAMPDDQLRRNGVDPEELRPAIEAIRAGDLARGIELTSPEVTERLSVSGTPAECAEKIKTQLAAAGVNHTICAVTDRTLVRAFTGRHLPQVPGAAEQLRLIHDHIMPAFA
ncbi:LLM class flavin-dependent oxidoreductase [Streptomyces clavuligerus]|nr:LLM class flavin-dependent oxidoreductase [Streptomyces clavuligerus]ANW22199.1 5,10-methylene tetrahydromethanopterin reductase [Streptomyces clavuligerus]AXU17090.1 LLM class flavin-dependent oxidoreductase [Streptomyces clavuligerus]EDY47752.1 5,10-methylenetetrahydromethanopterin reductase [Streptomyces clavuligerus]MBY6307266.1 LLM class flavin-dependent oxidoreductase [Streptomyces clavuligerus]QCS10161.1 LLM class flavin-dependent oxidoreductase [Streptomyces clavuligerus]